MNLAVEAQVEAIKDSMLGILGDQYSLVQEIERGIKHAKPSAKTLLAEKKLNAESEILEKFGAIYKQLKEVLEDHA